MSCSSRSHPKGGPGCASGSGQTDTNTFWTTREQTTNNKNNNSSMVRQDSEAEPVRCYGDGRRMNRRYETDLFCVYYPYCITWSVKCEAIKCRFLLIFYLNLDYLKKHKTPQNIIH